MRPLDRHRDRSIIQPVACEGSPVSPETADRSKPNTPLPNEFCETPWQSEAGWVQYKSQTVKRSCWESGSVTIENGLVQEGPGLAGTSRDAPVLTKDERLRKTSAILSPNAWQETAGSVESGPRKQAEP